MAALNQDRVTPQAGNSFDELELDVADETMIFKGSLVCAEAGKATPGREATGLVALGRAEQRRDTRANAETARSVIGGEKRIKIRRGTFGWANATGGDEITAADVESDCFVLNDQTVAKTDGGGTRSKAGRVVAVEAATDTSPATVLVDMR